MAASVAETSVSILRRIARQYRFFGVSAIVLLPCWWTAHIQSGDLASHVYNSWLAILAKQGRANGIFVAVQFSNVLFDRIYEAVASVVGFALAEHLVVSAVALVFFWSCFAFVASSSGSSPWHLVPFFAILTYGRIFKLGYMNYYLSTALAFAALACIWRVRDPRRVVAAAALLLLSATAQPLPPLWALCLVGYRWAESRVGSAGRLALLAGSIIGLTALAFLLRATLSFHYGPPKLHLSTGLEHFVPALSKTFLATFALIVCALFVYFLRGALTRRIVFDIWPVYLLFVCAGVVLPNSIVPPHTNSPFTLIPLRIGLFSSVFVLAALGRTRPTAPLLLMAMGAAGLYFAALLAYDIKLQRWEQRIDAVVSTVPQEARVVSVITGTPFAVRHLIDRACIGRCYSFANYEPTTGHFRVRAVPGSRSNVDTNDGSLRLQAGAFTVRPTDDPLLQIERCADRDDILCLRVLHAGDSTAPLH